MGFCLRIKNGSEVLSIIIRHRGAPRRSLGNYVVFFFIVAQRSSRFPSMLIIDRTFDSCDMIILCTFGSECKPLASKDPSS